MKITHNKVGQRLNLVDGVKPDNRADEAARAREGRIEQQSTADLDRATRVDLSSRASEARRIKELAMKAPDVDEAKVERLRKMIEDGLYNVDAKALADKMVDEELDLLSTQG
ncbi:MAG: flagellar biosynthesis anti-sigma factor FlgM [Bdellovibrionaceae bacterium]|nr:flagellar biosynthesis anti-sigma factor FlgM [Pseudobdellovibrionaceae bacterium]